MKNDLSFVHSETFGGNESCERQIVQFGDKEILGYEGIYPISLIKIEPLTPKFAEELGHRDYLGALMNLGIQRELLGDIFIKEKEAYVYCLSHISDFISDNLKSVRHTHVKVTIYNDDIDIIDAD